MADKQFVLGGIGKEIAATKEVQQISHEVKLRAEEIVKKKYEHFKAVTFATQTVAGTNYFIKVHVGGEDYIILKVFQSLPCNGGKFELKAVQASKKRHDAITLF